MHWAITYLAHAIHTCLSVLDFVLKIIIIVWLFWLPKVSTRNQFPRMSSITLLEISRKHINHTIEFEIQLLWDFPSANNLHLIHNAFVHSPFRSTYLPRSHKTEPKFIDENEKQTNYNLISAWILSECGKKRQTMRLEVSPPMENAIMTSSTWVIGKTSEHWKNINPHF